MQEQGSPRYEPQHLRAGQEHLGSFWWFPELQGPDLSAEVVPGQHEALSLLDNYSIAEIFSDNPEIQTEIFGPDTD